MKDTMELQTQMRMLGAVFGALALGAGCAGAPVGGTEHSARAQESRAPSAESGASDGLRTLKNLTSGELAQLFAQGTVDGIPVGEANGVPIQAPAVHVLNPFVDSLWSSKIFEPTHESVRNKRTFMAKTVRGQVSVGKLSERLGVEGGLLSATASDRRFSLDAAPSIIVDYSKSEVSLVRGIVDEIRHVMPQRYKSLYLGRATLDGKFFCYFALDFDR